MFMYHWNSNFVEKVVLERKHGGGDAFLVHYIVWKVSLRKLS